MPAPGPSCRLRTIGGYCGLSCSRGVGTAQVWPESLALVGFGLVLAALSVRRFSTIIE
jgi:hypothetical protein